MDNIWILKRCAICPEPVMFSGPSLLSNAVVWCGETCERIWDAMTPGQWIDAAELMPGGRFHDRPEVWQGS